MYMYVDLYRYRYIHIYVNICLIYLSCEKTTERNKERFLSA